MTSPIRPGASTPATTGTGPVTGPRPAAAVSTSRDTFRAAPTLALRSDLRNPITANPGRRIATLGDIREGIVQDFVAGQLRSGDRGAHVVQLLGSFPGFLHPNTPLSEWNPDQKPDLNVVGDTDVMLRQLAPMMGWDEATLEANLARARDGMVYFNLAIETPRGPVPFKMGMLDTAIWNNGSHPYFDLRSSLLQADGPSYVYLDGAGQGITPESFQSRLREVQRDYLGRSIGTFLFQGEFSAEDLVARRYRNQFMNYELYRFFDWTKGPKQAARYADRIPQIIIPPLQDFLRANPDKLEVVDGSGGILTPDQISPENFSELRFRWQMGFSDRFRQAMQSHLQFLGINARMGRQTFRNIGSNRTSRDGHHKVGWVQYGLRKFGRFFGVNGGTTPAEYRSEASHFVSQAERLGRTDNPVSQMVILAGYYPQDENDPQTFGEIVDYVEAEIAKGREPNILIKGNAPSKFSLPIRGVPVIAYRLMDALRSDAIQHVSVVGVPEVGTVVQAFKEHFAAEIAERGMSIEFINVGTAGGSFSGNINAGLESLPRRGEMAVLSFGDTPLVDPHNVAYHPWRHSMDFILGTNGRDMVLDFMGMNAHYEAQLDGVRYPFKEGNVQGLRTMPEGLWDDMFANRKSMRSGPMKKAGIFLRYLFQRPYHPDILNLPHLIGDAFLYRSPINAIHRMMGRQAPKVAADVRLGEEAMATRLGWNADFRAGHLDMGGLVDVDGIRDYVLADMVARRIQIPHFADLENFSKTTLARYADQLPALTGTPERINQIYTRVYHAILDREAKRTGEERLGINSDILSRKGIDPNRLPYTATGDINPEWLHVAIPEAEIQRAVRAFQAYENRTGHAQALESNFQSWRARRAGIPKDLYFPRLSFHPYRTRLDGPPELPRDTSTLASREVQKFVLLELARDPERYRGLILEWDFSRLREAVEGRARQRFGESAPEVEEVTRYFDNSLSEHQDTPLRRILLGMKAVDGVRRYQNFLSPAEFQVLYPQLVEHMHEAREVLPELSLSAPALGNYARSLNRFFFLQDYFNQAQVDADRLYVQRVGESPPDYRARGRVPSEHPLAYFRAPSGLPHSHSRPQLITGRHGEVRRVDTAVHLPEDIHTLAFRLRVGDYNLLNSRIPHLMAAAAGAETPAELGRVPESRMTSTRLLAWTQSEAGQRFLAQHQTRFQDSFRNRVIEGGPGFVTGIGALLGAEYLADQIGLDPVRNPHERFMFVVGASHLASSAVNPLTEVAVNRAMGAPFDFVTQRAVNAGGELGVQYSLHARRSLGSALWASSTRNFAAESGGVARSLLAGGRGLITLPIRASWNMGPGLMSAALTDRILSEGILDLEQGSTARRAIHFGSFFLPEFYGMTVGSRGPAIFRSRAMGYASRAFAAGFLADMGFSAINRIQHGSEGATRYSMIYQRANEMADAEEGSGVVDGAFEMVAPQVAAWWDSVELNGFGFRPNRFQRRATEELREFSQHAEQEGHSMLQDRLLQGAGGEEFSETFYTRVDLGFLREENRLEPQNSGRELPTELFAEDLAQSSVIRQEFYALRTSDDRVRYLQNRYSGWNLSAAEAQIVMDRLDLHRVRSDLGQLSALPFDTGRSMQHLFDETGSLRSGQEGALLTQVFEDPNMSEASLLTARRVRLVYQVMQFEQDPESVGTDRGRRLSAVARQLGLRDADGQWSEGPEVQAARNLFGRWRESHSSRPLTLMPLGSSLAPRDTHAS